MLHDTEDIKARLRRLVREAEVDRWLVASNAMLDGLSPRDAIACGLTDRVSELLVRLEEGIYV